MKRGTRFMSWHFDMRVRFVETGESPVPRNLCQSHFGSIQRACCARFDTICEFGTQQTFFLAIGTYKVSDRQLRYAVDLKKVKFFYLPKERSLNCLGKTSVGTPRNVLKCRDLYRHIIYQNDPMAKPDFMAMVPDLYRRRR